MTHDEIDKLEAGPELDCLIANKIMGASLAVKPWGDSEYHVVIPAYSADIAAAWGVVEKLHTTVDLSGGTVYAYTIGQGWHDCPEFESSAPTAPLAICRAALKALAEQVDS